MQNHQELSGFDPRIEERLRDDAWDLRMASGIVSAHAARRKKTVLLTGLTLAFASFALVFSALLVDFHNGEAPYYTFISSQINGASDASSRIAEDDMDDLIEDALTSRL